MTGLIIVSIILQLIGISLLVVILKTDKLNTPEPKKDKYEDYRDPATGRLRGKKVGM